MRCETCGRPMTPLFTSLVCDYCDGHKTPAEGYHLGYVVWRGVSSDREDHVFPSRDHAERWRRARRLEMYPIRRVFSEQPFIWRDGKGPVQNLRFADKLYRIYPDHRFVPGPRRAFLGPITDASDESEG